MLRDNIEPDKFVLALISLIEGWSNGPEDLGVLTRAFKDTDDSMLGSNVDIVLRNVVEKLSFCSDFKIKEFAHRHEIKYTAKYWYSRKCQHNSTAR